MADKFYIADYQNDSGLRTDLKPFLIPDKAFSSIRNAYVFRGRVRKRFGSRYIGGTQLTTRLAIDTGDATNGSGNVSGSIPSNITPAIGQMFSIGTALFTVNALGTSANLLRTDGVAATATFNTSTGAFVINGATPTTEVYFYPALPVMGLLTYELNGIDEEPTIAFDTHGSYQYVNGGWVLITGGGAAAQWLGDDSQFFWGTTWSGSNAATRLFFVTNFNNQETQFMRYLDSTFTWHSFAPEVDGSPTYMISARILVVFKNRLVAFNTWENSSQAVGGTNYQNRARWSQIGDPTAVDAWRVDIVGNGGGLDAPTMEGIITVEFVKDRLIVYFEQSTWEFVYTGNQVYPFVWQQINTEIGAESTFSIVPFDKIALGVGNVGIVSCNGTNVERIDANIPDEVFQIHNDNNGVERVYGIRDYFAEMVYWTFPSLEAGTNYPNRVLIYNYKTGTWAYNDDSITCFGYFQQQTSTLWSSTTVTWSDSESWTGGNQQDRFRNVVAGNQQGWTFIVDPNQVQNAAALQITDIPSTANNSIQLTIINHNLAQGNAYDDLEPDYVLLNGITGTGNLNLLNGNIYQVISVIDDNNVIVNYTQTTDIISGTYSGGGTVQRVSQIDIFTKEYNFYAQQGMNAAINKLDFMCDTTGAGAFTVDYYTSTDIVGTLEDGIAYGSIQGNGQISTEPNADYYPYEANASRLWRSTYPSAQGEVIQFRIYLAASQITTVVNNTGPGLEDFQMHAMVIHATPTSRLQ